MPISTNSIIHYTTSLENLKSILIEGFRIKYCLEVLNTVGDKKTSAAHPMVCFCDIPLSESYTHIDAYGSFGIGLTKEWAAKMKINPVLYIDKGSLIGESLRSQFVDYIADPKSYNKKQYNHLLTVKSLTKNYSGLLKRNKVDNPNYKFYDEREWRLIPEQKDVEYISLKADAYLTDKEKYNNSLEGLRYKFEPSDISYLIVEDDNEILELIKFLRYSYKCTPPELDILFSKICSVKQIKNDY